MIQDAVLFMESEVCDGDPTKLKWGTLILYSAGFVFHYNRPMKDNPGRMMDVMDMNDIQSVTVEKIDWLVSKIFWVGRKLVVVRTIEGEKRYYMRKPDDLFAALRFIKPSIPLVDRHK